MTISELDWAWAAGIFDGEGSVYIARQAPRGNRCLGHALIVSVLMTHEPTLRRINGILGGHLQLKRQKTAGGRQIWAWHQSGPGEVSRILTHLRPYMTTKAVEVWLALEAAASWCLTPRGGSVEPETLALREGFYLALKEAKHDGLPR